MKIKILRVNAFTDSEKGGNPAGVLVDSPNLTAKQMAFVTEKLKVSETAFVFPSDKADYKVFFYTPAIEVELCGHATIATFYTMASKGLLSKNRITQETKAGILPVDVHHNLDGSVEKVMMTQGKSISKDMSLDIFNVAASLKISPDDIDTTLPCQAVSTGLFTLPICVKSFDILKNMKPDFNKIEKICNKNNFGSFHVFTLDTKEPDSTYHARNFAPVYGINEDPVTGTANGAVCSYLLKNGIIKGNNFVCEQGDIIGRPGRVHVEITEDVVKVGGIAKIVEEVEINL